MHKYTQINWLSKIEDKVCRVFTTSLVRNDQKFHQRNQIKQIPFQKHSNRIQTLNTPLCCKPQLWSRFEMKIVSKT